MRCRACGEATDSEAGVALCAACTAVSGQPTELARTADSALWLWTSADARAALASGKIGPMIRAWRLATSTSQHALAEQLGYDPSYISMIETGRRDVTDVTARRRIAVHLGIPLHRVGLTDEAAADHIAMLQFGRSVLRLAVLARRGGQGTQAVNEAWPLVARLEARVAEGMFDRDVLLLLAQARCELAVSLGYVLPEERLSFAVRSAVRAVRLSEHLDDARQYAYGLRVLGNELRKAGHRTTAAKVLDEAVTMAAAEQRPAALAQLARSIDDPQHFDQIVADLSRQADRVTSDDMVLGPIAMWELRMRGLLTTGRAAMALDLVDKPPTAPGQPPPQWRVIEQITVAEVLITSGDIANAEQLLFDAIAAAERHRLPHQVQRAARAAHLRSPAASEAASQALSRLTAPHVPATSG